ncbi:MAG: molybdopterin-guanine dinucleotide biosynthesis protein MobB [Gammaproteobacteria bacterium]|jgi:molybdopterin-guanine dinucleotide biosynthesis protein MobB|nr:molybdopterin-guanine dinucleotide biosynthesis protein MobB [Gammaproteobacteria bacterium]
MVTARCPVLGFAAYSGTGKTTLLVQLLPRLRAAGLRIGMIKHAHHRFEIDHPGKDSYELRKAGASQMLITSSRRWALVTDLDDEHDAVLQEALERLDQRELDLILVEGFKHEHFPKIELHRPAVGNALIFPDDSNVIAIATDAPLTLPTTLPVLDLNDVDAIADFVRQFLVSVQSSGAT